MTREMENPDVDFGMLFENMLNGYAYCQMIFEEGKPVDLIYLFVNKAFSALTGLENVVGKKVSEVIPGHTTSNPELFEIYGSVATTGKPERFETYVEELKIWLDISVYCPKKGFFVAVFENITERKNAEKKLIITNLKLEAFWDVATIEDKDVKTFCDQVLASLTKMTMSPFGFYGFLNDDESVMTIHSWSGEAMKGCSMVTKPSDFPIEQAGVWGEAIRHRAPFILNEYDVHHPAKKGLPEGHVALTRILVVPIFSHDKIVAVAAVANRDTPYNDSDINNVNSFAIAVQAILERKIAKESLIKSNIELAEKVLELKESVKAKLESLGLVAGGIAHNFNNLMGGIFGYIDMANETSDKNIASLYLTKAINTIDRARGLTAKLLTFAKGGDPVQIHTPLIPFLKETVQTILDRLSVPYKLDIATDLKPCSIDKNQICQALECIIINAKEAMQNPEPIILTAKNLFMDEKEHPSLHKGNYVKISIKDFGIGIQSKDLSRIFDPFYTTKSTGQGLGLATCYSIINRHGGAIGVESEPGKGSTFHIYLPASSEIDTTTSIMKSSTKSSKGIGTFLIMDDEEVVRETTTNILVSLGYTVVCKENGRDTLDFFIAETKNNRNFTGLILDLTIPNGMGGKATVAEIRKLNSEIPIFVASGYADDPVVKNPTKYGFTASICKPYRKSELSDMLNKYLKPNQ